jgi:uncharacterized membrane protein YqgA involved in biofilm formation
MLFFCAANLLYEISGLHIPAAMRHGLSRERSISKKDQVEPAL